MSNLLETLSGCSSYAFATAEGAFADEVHTILLRMREFAVQAAKPEQQRWWWR